MLKDKTVLITGANGGIGNEVSKIFVKNNAKVILIYHEKKNEVSKIVNSNKNTIIKKIDLLNENEISKSIKLLLKKSEIDIFIHLPTLTYSHSDILKNEWKDYEKNIELQVKSLFLISKYLLPGMQKRRYGKIISVLTSFVIGKPPSGISDYIVSKYALMGLIKCMAVEFGKFGINVNAISPSIIETPLTEKLPSKLKEITKMQTPLNNELISTNDVANLILFLCKKESASITGENIIISGGHTMFWVEKRYEK